MLCSCLVEAEQFRIACYKEMRGRKAQCKEATTALPGTSWPNYMDQNHPETHSFKVKKNWTARKQRLLAFVSRLALELAPALPSSLHAGSFHLGWACFLKLDTSTFASSCTGVGNKHICRIRSLFLKIILKIQACVGTLARGNILKSIRTKTQIQVSCDSKHVKVVRNLFHFCLLLQRNQASIIGILIRNL